MVTRDLSSTGMAVWTPDPKSDWKDSDVIRLRLVHRFGNIDVDARVVHLHAEWVGLQFEGLESETRAKLEYVLSEFFKHGNWDRRRSSRRPFSLPVTWVYGPMEVQSYLTDLSRTGAYILSRQSIPVGENLHLYLPAAGTDDHGVNATGCRVTVAHCRADGFGVSFMEPSDKFEEAVAGYLRHEAERIS